MLIVVEFLSIVPTRDAADLNSTLFLMYLVQDVFCVCEGASLLIRSEVAETVRLAEPSHVFTVV